MINDYKEVKECVYKGELYSVRDNGAVFRHKREGKRLRFDDEKWTFGFKNSKTGYMLLGDHRVHIIVATAFLGERDSKKFVVDHIDTNRCNNRVENLRWFTRLENVLNNEITRNKIIAICGSIEAFIENPNILREFSIIGGPSLSWMRTVTSEEAKIAHENLKKFWEEQAQNPRPLVGGKINDNIFQDVSTTNVVKHNVAVADASYDQENISSCVLTTEQTNELMNLLQQQYEEQKSDSHLELCNRVSFEEWYNSSQKVHSRPISGQMDNDKEVKSGFVQAESPDTALQKNWKTPAIFLCCPTSIGSNPLQEYYNQLVIGDNYNVTMFSEFNCLIQRTIDKAYTKDNSAIVVLSSTDDYLRLSKIYFSAGKFIHEHLQKYKCSQKKQAFEHFVSELGLTIEEYKLKRLFSESNLVKAKSPETAWQINWKTPTDFLCCPSTIEENPIEEYYNRIFIGEAYNSTNFYGSNEVQKVIDKAHAKGNTIIVLSCNPNSIKPYALCKIHYFEGKFIHESMGTFFREDGGRKYFTLAQGLEWTGEDPFDDYC